MSRVTGRPTWQRWGVVGLGLWLIHATPARADIYTWLDDRGVQNFVDNQAAIPERYRDQARLMIESTASAETEPASTPIETVPSLQEEKPAPPRPEGQGALAVALAETLGLATRPTPQQAAIVLLERGILPPAGWMLDEPVDPRWMTDLAHSLLAASATGQIGQSPETAFRTLEAVAADVGIALVALELPRPSEPAVVAAPPQAVVVERIFVPAFSIHRGRFFHQPGLPKRFFTDHRHFYKSDPHSRHTRAYHRHPSMGNFVKVPRVGGHGFRGERGHRWVFRQSRPGATGSPWRFER